MRKTALLTGLAVVMSLGLTATKASAVPSFARMTGLTCNQCHVSFSPVPTFTFTGKKFRINGYRAPHVASKMEAGEEGKVNGKRLAIGLSDYLSFRFGSTLLGQSKSSWDPTKPEPTSSSLTTNPYTNAAIYFVGPIGDHIGMWNEFYFSTGGVNSTNGVNGPQTNTFRIIGYDEYDVKFTWNTESSIYGVNLSTQSLNQSIGFGPFPTGLTSQMQRGGFAQAHPPYANLSAYGFFADRLAVVVGITPGEDNMDYSCHDKNANGRRDDGNCMAYQGMVAYAIKNSDENELWVDAFVKVGNDGVPIVSNTSLSADRSKWSWSDAISGISATRTNLPVAQRLPYTNGDIGDFFRSYWEINYGTIDRGPHSLAATVRLNINNEEYADKSKVVDNALGLGVRYIYDRTYGLNLALEQDLKYEFTSVTGTVLDVPRSFGFTTTASYRPAMNFSVNLTAGNTRATRIVPEGTERYNNGWSWNLALDYLF
jgi:hypothetical protein